MRLDDGPLAGAEAILECDNGRYWAILLMGILGRETRIKVAVSTNSSMI